MDKIIKQDDQVFKALDLKTIDRLICYTDKGLLTLKIRKGDSKYHLCLDSVPLDASMNKELMDILFPIKAMEVPTVNKNPMILSGLTSTDSTNEAGLISSKNKGGRPKKNGKTN